MISKITMQSKALNQEENAIMSGQDNVYALLDSRSEVNIMTPVYIAKLNLVT